MTDSGSIVLGWLTKLTVVIGLLGLLAFDGISLVQTTFNTADHASAAARVAADTYKETKDVQAAYNAAVASVLPQGETIEAKTFVVNPTNGKVTLVVHKDAATLWLHKVGPLKKFVDVSSTGEGAPAQ